MHVALSRIAGAAAVLASTLVIAATPDHGTVTEAQDAAQPLTYAAGPFAATNTLSKIAPGECAEGGDPFADGAVACDVYRLTVQLPDDFDAAHPGQSVHVRIDWTTPNDDFDLYLYDAEGWTYFPTTQPVAKSTGVAGTTEQLEVPATGGVHEFVIQTDAFVALGASFEAKVWIGAAETVPTTVLPATPASGIAPRFQNFVPTDAAGVPSAGMGTVAGEPTMFVNPKTGSVFTQSLFEILRLKFDDATSPPAVTWEARDKIINVSNKVTVDPILLGDPDTGRIWAMQLSGGQSVTDYSDDDGETWMPTLSGGFGSGADHQGMGVGPYPAGSVIPHPLYPNAVYYCSQDVATAFCSRSDDGGVTFGPVTPIYDSVTSKCVGLHGHPTVGPDGTVYVPNKGCGLDTPVIGTGKINVVVSEDAGLTWQVRFVDDSTGGLTDKGDPSAAVDRDGTLYLAYTNLDDDHLRVAVSTDHGRSFQPSVDVGALAGVTHSMFPAAVAGDRGRAAVAFFGTTYTGTEAPATDMLFQGLWYLYVATTYDGGLTWFVQNVTPNDPIQGIGGFGNGGDNRNHYDFFDTAVDPQGRILVTYQDGCTASCPRGGPDTFSKLAVVLRQSGGRRLYAAFDPVEPALPPAPRLAGWRTADYTVLDWGAVDNGGAPLKGYRLYRSVDGGVETLLAHVVGRTRFADATDATHHYQYRLRAVGELGEGAWSAPFAPEVTGDARTPEKSCTLPGQVYADRVGEGAAYPPNDIASIAVAEPQDLPGKLVFSVINVTALPQQAGTLAYVYFDHPASGLRYRLRYSATGTSEIASFKDGDIDAANPEAALYDYQLWTPVGALDAGSGVQPDGSIRLVIDKATLGIRTGHGLLGIAAREDVVGSPSGVLAADYAGGRNDYRVVGNDFCTAGRALPPPLPVARDDRYFGTAGTARTLRPLQNDSWPGARPQIVAVGRRDHGGQVTISADGYSLTYVPQAGFTGVEQFTYTMRNGVGSSRAMVSVTVR